MAKFDPFESYAQEYDEWFDKNRFVYKSELQAVKELLPRNKNGMEVGVGSSRFRSQFNIKLGVDPVRKWEKLPKKEILKSSKELLYHYPSLMQILF
jgi:hypothetical protein